MKTKIITQDIIISKIQKIISKLNNINYKLTKKDFMILEIGFLRLKNHLYTKKDKDKMNGNELFWDIVINFKPLLTKKEFIEIINIKRKKDLVLTSFLENQINIFNKKH